MNETPDNPPADWVLIEAAKRSVWDNLHIEDLRRSHRAEHHGPFRALCDMIAKHEPNPMTIEAREIAADARCPGYERISETLRDSVAVKIANGEWDDHMLMRAALKGIERGQQLATQERAK